jgi:hypothetical protein
MHSHIVIPDHQQTQKLLVFIQLKDVHVDMGVLPL